MIVTTDSYDDCACHLVAGDGVSVDAERSVHGALGKGSIDYTIQYDGFSIVVLEVSQTHDYRRAPPAACVGLLVRCIEAVIAEAAFCYITVAYLHKAPPTVASWKDR